MDISSLTASDFGIGITTSLRRRPKVSITSLVNCFVLICLFTIYEFNNPSNRYSSIKSLFFVLIFINPPQYNIFVSLDVIMHDVPTKYVPSLTINMSPACTSSLSAYCSYISSDIPCLASAFISQLEKSEVLTNGIFPVPYAIFPISSPVDISICPFFPNLLQNADHTKRIMHLKFL